MKNVKVFMQKSKTITIIPIIIIALWELFSTQAAAASFDCKKASTWLEKTVCSNPELSKLDEELAKAYYDALASLSPEGQKETKEYQMQWLKEISYIKARSDKFYAEHKEFLDQRNKAIIRDIAIDYEQRIKELKQILTKFPPRIFRKVYISNVKTNENCEYLIVRRKLSYSQIENPSDENEKFCNNLISKKVSADFKKNSKGNDCTDILDGYGVSFSNKHLISFQGSQYHYSHGNAHGYTDAEIYFSWLLEDKRELKATDLFDDKTGWRKKLPSLVAQKWKKKKVDNKDNYYGPSIKEVTSPKNWLISKDGMEFQFRTFNSMGEDSITIDWKTLDPYLSKKGRSLIYD